MTDETTPVPAEKPAKKKPEMVHCPTLKLDAVIKGQAFKAGENPKDKYPKHVVDDLRKRGAI